jgi:DNA-binding GntR family transcriptional regulator
MRLAKEFGVAQGVIRESLLELKACGLVETVDNLGVFVSNLDAVRLIQAYEIREVLEGLAARLCCQRASRADLAELTEIAQRIYRLARQGKKEDMGALDREFHHRIIRISRNEMLEQLTESYRVLGKVLRVDRNARAVRDDHQAILKAIQTNQPDRAERLMRDHIRAAKTTIEQRVADGTFVPQWV